MDRRRPRNVPSRPLVLVADDHADTRDLYVVSLGILGFDTIEAADFQQAYHQAWESHPDIVVTEVTLPGGGEWQLLHLLKREARTREIPVVLVTGYDAPALRARAECEGCASFFVKPCLPDELAVELRHLLERTTEHARLSASG